MKVFLGISIMVVAVLSLFNKKLSVFKIIKEQFIVYKNDITQKIALYDLFTFFLAPFLMALAGSFLIPNNAFIKASESCITIFSIIATILFSFLALLMDKKYNKGEVVKKESEVNDEEAEERKKFEQVSTETYISITMTIIYSLVAVAIAIALLIVNNIILIQILNGLMLYFIIKIVYNFLMILKRMFILLR